MVKCEVREISTASAFSPSLVPVTMAKKEYMTKQIKLPQIVKKLETKQLIAGSSNVSLTSVNWKSLI
jgi:hypothetical protein